jgi:hypothetical protein
MYVLVVILVLRILGLVHELPGLPISFLDILITILIGLMIAFASRIWGNWKKIMGDFEELKERIGKVIDLQSSGMEKNLKIQENLSKLENLLSKEKESTES